MNINSYIAYNPVLHWCITKMIWKFAPLQMKKSRQDIQITINVCHCIVLHNNFMQMQTS